MANVNCLSRKNVNTGVTFYSIDSEVTFASKSLRVFGPKVRNSLQYHIKSSKNLESFKTIIDHRSLLYEMHLQLRFLILRPVFNTWTFHIMN